MAAMALPVGALTYGSSDISDAPLRREWAVGGQDFVGVVVRAKRHGVKTVSAVLSMGKVAERGRPVPGRTE